MENRNLAWIILISVIVFVIASMAIPVLIGAQAAGPGQDNAPPQPGQRPRPAQGQDEMKQLKTAISFVNIALILPLLVIYAGIYRRMRSSFTLGLMAVIIALGMYAVTSNPLIVSLLGGRTGEIGLFQIIPDLCATVALVILVRISLE
jgi:hypothetical protein